jgi:hypothetical protein
MCQQYWNICGNFKVLCIKPYEKIYHLQFDSLKLVPKYSLKIGSGLLYTLYVNKLDIKRAFLNVYER